MLLYYMQNNNTCNLLQSVYECIATQFVWIGIKKYFFFTLQHIKNNNNNNDDNNNAYRNIL